MEHETTPIWSRFHLAAAAVAALIFLVHTFVGGPEINAPTRASDFDPLLRAVLTVVWHIVTWTLAVMALATLALARRRNPALEAVILALNLGAAALFLGYGLADLGSVTAMPQWTLFVTVALLMGLGQWRRAVRSRQPK